MSVMRVYEANALHACEPVEGQVFLFLFPS